MSDFRYSRLMEVKERLLDQKQGELETALTAVQTVIAKINAVDSEVAETYNNMTDRCLFGKELSTMIEHVVFLDRKKALLNEERRQNEAAVNSLRKELLDLEIALKMLERLKSRILQTIKKTKFKKEQKLMDELALRAGGR